MVVICLSTLDGSDGGYYDALRPTEVLSPTRYSLVTDGPEGSMELPGPVPASMEYPVLAAAGVNDGGDVVGHCLRPQPGLVLLIWPQQ